MTEVSVERIGKTQRELLVALSGGAQRTPMMFRDIAEPDTVRRSFARLVDRGWVEKSETKDFQGSAYHRLTEEGLAVAAALIERGDVLR